MSVQLFRGPVSECLVHYANSKWSGDHTAALADFTGAKLSSVTRWFKGEHPPIGEYAVSVQHYLGFVGYNVAEVERLDPSIRGLGELISLRVLTIDDVVGQLEYEASDNKGRSLFFNVLLKGTSMMAKRMVKAREIYDAYAGDLDTKRQNFERTRITIVKPYAVIGQQKSPNRDLLERKHTRAAPVQGLDEEVVTEEKRDVLSQNGCRSIAVAAGLVKLLTPHVEKLASGKTSTAERKKFLSMAGDISQLAENLIVIATKD